MPMVPGPGDFFFPLLDSDVNCAMCHVIQSAHAEHVLGSCDLFIRLPHSLVISSLAHLRVLSSILDPAGIKAAFPKQLECFKYSNGERNIFSVQKFSKTAAATLLMKQVH